MENKTIKIVGLIIIIISSLMIFSNTMGAIVWAIIWGTNDISSANSNFSFEQKISLISLTVVIIGILFLIGGIFIRKLKLWANQFVSILSLCSLILMWTFIINFLIGEVNGGIIIIKIVLLIISIIFSIPLTLLIWFLNRKKTKTVFY